MFLKEMPVCVCGYNVDSINHICAEYEYECDKKIKWAEIRVHIFFRYASKNIAARCQRVSILA